MPEFQIDFANGGGCNGWGGIISKIGVQYMLKVNSFWLLDRVILFVAMYVDWKTGLDSVGPMMMVRTCFSKIVCEVAGEAGEQLWSADKVMKQGEKIKVFQTLLPEVFMRHSDSGLYTSKHHFPDLLVKDM